MKDLIKNQIEENELKLSVIDEKLEAYRNARNSLENLKGDKMFFAILGGIRDMQKERFKIRSNIRILKNSSEG